MQISRLGRGSRFRALATRVVVVAVLIVLCSGCTAAFGATTISVSSLAAGLGDAGAGRCTLRDALVVADLASNPALGTRAEPGGSDASRDCRGRVRGRGSPYEIRLAAGAVYTLTMIDDYWFGPDGLPPVSAEVTIVGNGATITRSAGRTPGFRFFYVSGGLSGIPVGQLTLQHVVLSNGLAEGGASGGGGGGAGMGGAIFNQGVVALEHVTLSGNEAQGATGSGPALDGSGGGIGPDGGFGGPAPGALGGAGGSENADLSRGANDGDAGGGGGFRAADPGHSGASGGAPGGKGGFGSGGGDGGYGGNGDDDDGAGGAFGRRGGTPHIFGGPNGDGVGAGGGGGVGGGGALGANATGSGGGFAGGGSQAGCDSGGCSGGDGGFGGGGAGSGDGGNDGKGGFGAGHGDGNEGGGGAGMGGAVFSLFGTVSASDSTLSANSAIGGPGDATSADGTAGDGLGGAIFNVDGTLAVSGSTIAQNTAEGGASAGGGVYSLAFGNTITRGGVTVATVEVAGSSLTGNHGAGDRADDLALNRINGKHANASTGTVLATSIVGATTVTGGALEL
jgi:hypothetical protein